MQKQARQSKRTAKSGFCARNNAGAMRMHHVGLRRDADAHHVFLIYCGVHLRWE